jgi:predicted DCC family thiol-disulfide oxidoreductase YuxK
MGRKIQWVQKPPRGWVLYDADCGFCTRWAWRIALFVGPRGFHLAPLQAPWVHQQLARLGGRALSESELLHELRVLTADDAIYGGAEAFVFLARQIWWAWPVAALMWLPGMMSLSRAVYRWVARHRHVASPSCALAAAGGHRKPSTIVPHSRAGRA